MAAIERNGNILPLSPVDGGDKDRIPRDPIVEAWENAPAEFIHYVGSSVYHPDGSLYYRYDPGTRLLIAGQEVMDSCETPWSIAIVNAAFQHIESDDYVRVFEAGAGQNITGNRIMQKLEGMGKGEYHVAELNKAVYAKTLEWREGWERHFRAQRAWARGTEPDIRIYVYHGEAGEVAEQLLAEKRRFKLIISDTFPLHPEERGINDLKHLDKFSRILMRDGMFGFYPYTPGTEIGSAGKMMADQYDLLNPYFDHIALGEARPINPPLDYKYLQGKFGPVRSLPVPICRGLKVTA